MRGAIFLQVLLFLVSLTFPALAQELPEGIQPECRKYFKARPMLLEGGSAVFDDCVISVGTSAFRGKGDCLMTALAFANARAGIASALGGALIEANEKTAERSSLAGDKGTFSSERISRIRKVIENGKTDHVTVCGEWLSPDGKTYFAAMVRFFGEPPKRMHAGLPSFVSDFKAEAGWRDALLTLGPLMRGGATLYQDEYGETWLIAVSNASLNLPYSDRLQILQIKAEASAVEYVNGGMLRDMQYLEEHFSSRADSNAEETQDSGLIRKRLQERSAIGYVRNTTPIGAWELNDARRACMAFALRLSDISMESFPVQPEGANESSDTIEIDAERKSADNLTAALKKAVFYENENEITVVLPDEDPVFSSGENEIDLVDPFRDAESAARFKILRLPIGITVINHFNLPEININFSRTEIINAGRLGGRMIPVRIRRPRIAHHPPHKRIVLRRHGHFKTVSGRRKFHRSHHPPRFNIRTPGKNGRAKPFRRHPGPRRHKRK